ncbi:MAG: undecaprenyl-diphosphate phosphatase [Pirellulaceae bacterium]
MISVVILAIVQGIAEFLPISSSGHLVILGAILENIPAISGNHAAIQNESPTLEIILHAGTLGSILLIYWRKILDLLTRDRRVIAMLVVGTIPAAVVGLTIKKAFPQIMKDPMLAGSMLLVTGAFLLVLGRLRPRDSEYQSMSLVGAFAVGCFQAFAVLPGVSRSGSTILGGRLLGLKNEDSVTFSFLLAIPAILGATALQLKDLVEQIEAGVPQQYTPWELASGAFISFIVGIFALKWLIGWSRQDRLHLFAWWCIPVGIGAIVMAAQGII